MNAKIYKYDLREWNYIMKTARGVEYDETQYRVKFGKNKWVKLIPLFEQQLKKRERQKLKLLFNALEEFTTRTLS